MAVFMIDHPHDLPTRGLAGFTVANTDAYTNFAASIMCNPFQLSINGQRHISSALTNLPLYRAADENLAFGWTENNIMRTSYVNVRGYEHVCVMVALSGTFHESYSAEVMHEMACMVAGPEDVLPHIKQWKELLRTANGAFASYDFDIVVEDMIRLDPYSVGPGSNLIARRCRVPPLAMAKGLLALSKLLKSVATARTAAGNGHGHGNGNEAASHKVETLTLVGGATVGWFAAFAEYFYDLRVALMSASGTQLHGHPIDKDPQVVLIYHSNPDLEVQDPVRPFQFEADAVDEIKERLGDLAYTKHVHFLPFGGRVVWQSLLPKVFGAAYHRLDHEEAHTLAAAIGAAAKSLEAAVVDSANGANPASYGIGLIQTITAWLPDLRRGQARMERQLKKTPEEAADTYVKALKSLAQICQCNVCISLDPSSNSNKQVNDPGVTISITQDQPAPSSSTFEGEKAPKKDNIKSEAQGTSSTRQPKDSYCLPIILETIIALGLQVSQLIVTRNLYPSREGIQALYTSQVKKRIQAHTQTPESNPSNFRQHFEQIFSDEWNAPPSTRLQNAISLFSGRRPVKNIPRELSSPNNNKEEKEKEGREKKGLVGLSSEGICAYMARLEKFDLGITGREKKKNTDTTIKVVTGAIYGGRGTNKQAGKIFTRVSTRPVFPGEFGRDDEDEDWAWEGIKFDHFDGGMLYFT